MRKASIVLVAGAAVAALVFAVWDADAQTPAADPAATTAQPAPLRPAASVAAD